MPPEKPSPADRRALVSRRLRRFDAKYFAEYGVELLCGVDEAGRGALAGPVVAAAVVLDAKAHIVGVNDSKQVAPEEREALYDAVCMKARAVAIGYASAREIDQINILQATILASKRAIGALWLKPSLVLTDALKIEVPGARVEPLVKGDARSQAIAAASIIAKVTRDRWMRALDGEYPQYGFASHKGYGAQAHLEALRVHGSSTIHRHTFNGVDWFEGEYRTSAEFVRMCQKLGAMEQDERDLQDLERRWPMHLPECEVEMFRDLAQERAQRNHD